MKIIFLDIDGVLNSMDDRFSQKLETEEHLLLLKELVEKTNAKIVVSSSWRGIPSLMKTLHKKMKEINAEIIGTTKSLPGTRGVEIKDWLENSPELIESFVILDDDSDMDDLFDHLVQTSTEKGLTRIEMEEALDKLLCSSVGRAKPS